MVSQVAAHALTVVRPAVSSPRAISRCFALILALTSASDLPVTVTRRRAPERVKPCSMVPSQRPSEARW
jgi:hypothetical protein